MEETARGIATKLREHNHIAYFAGGCVRDMVRGLTPKDIDIATDARPEEVQKIFPAHLCGRRAFRRHCRFGKRIPVRSRYFPFR